MCRRELAEEAVEPTRRCEDEHAPRTGDDAPLRMRDAARPECETARPEVDLLVGDLDDVLALECVEELILVLVNVQRCVDQRWHLLEEAEGAAGRLGRGSDEDGHASETSRSPPSGSSAKPGPVIARRLARARQAIVSTGIASG